MRSTGSSKVMFFLAALGFATIAILRGTPAQALAEVFYATADNYVESGQFSNDNFGYTPILEVGNGISSVSAYQNTEWTYLKFDISGYSGVPITSATLSLYGSHQGASISDIDSAYDITNTSWTQLGITWNNKPPLGALQSTTPVGNVAQYYSWDVTKAVQTAISASTSRIISIAVAPQLASYGGGMDIFQSSFPGPAGPNYNPPILVISNPT